MSAPAAGKFQDHYIVLDIDPKSSSDLIQRAYTSLAAKYNPRGGAFPDQEKFDAISLAYEVLLDPGARAAFDSLRPSDDKADGPKFTGLGFFTSGEGETARRRAVLCVMYDRSRQKPIRPGLSMRHLEMMLNLTTEQLQFAIWYLKARGYAMSDDKSQVMITVEGMDYIDKNFPKPEEIMPFLRATAIAS
jgi:curved DNA-binding protein CbpA